MRRRTPFVALGAALLIGCTSGRDSVDAPDTTGVVAPATSPSAAPGTSPTTIATEQDPTDSASFVLDGLPLVIQPGTDFELAEAPRVVLTPNGRTIGYLRYVRRLDDGAGGEIATVSVVAPDDPLAEEIGSMAGLDDGTAQKTTDGDDRFVTRFKRVGDRIVQVAFTTTSPESADRFMRALTTTR